MEMDKKINLVYLVSFEVEPDSTVVLKTLL